jgi:hypothetical protein
MTEFIGVKSPLSFHYSYSIKRESLLFDRIAIPQIREFIMTNESNEAIACDVAELEWLIGQGIVFESGPLPDDSLLENKQFRDSWGLYSNTFNEAQELAKEYELNIPVVTQSRGDNSQIERLVEYKNGLLLLTPRGVDLLSLLDKIHEKTILGSDLIARLVSIQLRQLNSMDAYPILDSDLSLTVDTKANKTDIVEIVLNALPVPDDSVAWEKILDYRNDPDTRGKFLALRQWMNKLVRGQVSTNEVEDELECLIHNYQEHLKFHRMKINQETWKTLVVAQADFVPNLLKLKWGEIAKALFTLKHRQISLIESELTAPGREISYIVETRKRFTSAPTIGG